LRLAITRLKLDKESRGPLEIHLVHNLAAGMALIRSLTPDTAIQNNNINLDLAERREAATARADASRTIDVAPPLAPSLRPVEIGDRF
jgi:hypothetical protein